MSTDNKFTNKDSLPNIPILNDRCETAQPTTKPHSTSANRDLSGKNNPFLPYETLERLANERRQFQKQLAEFGQYFEFPQSRGYSLTESALQEDVEPSVQADNTECIKALIKSTTQTVMSEYAAEIEMEIYRRVKTKLLGA